MVIACFKLTGSSFDFNFSKLITLLWGLNYFFKLRILTLNSKYKFLSPYYWPLNFSIPTSFSSRHYYSKDKRAKRRKFLLKLWSFVHPEMKCLTCLVVCFILYSSTISYFSLSLSLMSTCLQRIKTQFPSYLQDDNQNVLLPSTNNDKLLQLKPTNSASGCKICFVLLVGLNSNYSNNILESNGKFMSLFMSLFMSRLV